LFITIYFPREEDDVAVSPSHALEDSVKSTFLPQKLKSGYVGVHQLMGFLQTYRNCSKHVFFYSIHKSQADVSVLTEGAYIEEVVIGLLAHR
jgi:hypothetical protein